MENANMHGEKRPEVVVFAGPNGSGKSTITKLAKVIEPYINADFIKASLHCDDLAAAIEAEKQRENCVKNKQSFTFETVLSTERNLNLLKRAKDAGFFIRCIYVLTSNPIINVQRVSIRVQNGGHDVPRDKIISRYAKCLELLPELIEVCDICHIYDNTDIPFRIFKKRKTEYFYWENEFWNMAQIKDLVGCFEHSHLPIGTRA